MMKKISLLLILCLSSIYAFSDMNHTKIYNIDKNTSTGMRFTIELLDEKLIVENIQFIKHANIWHLSMDPVTLDKDLNITKKNGLTYLKIIRQKTNNETMIDYRLSQEEFSKILQLSLHHVKKEFPTAYLSHIRISTPLVNEFWASILPLSVKATLTEKGPFILKENSIYDTTLQSSIDKEHSFIQPTCQIFKDVIGLECDKKQPIYITNHSFNQKYINNPTLWKAISALKEDAFDRKSPKSSYIRFNFSNALPIQDAVRLGIKK